MNYFELLIAVVGDLQDKTTFTMHPDAVCLLFIWADSGKLMFALKRWRLRWEIIKSYDLASEIDKIRKMTITLAGMAELSG